MRDKSAASSLGIRHHRAEADVSRAKLLPDFIKPEWLVSYQQQQGCKIYREEKRDSYKALLFTR